MSGSTEPEGRLGFVPCDKRREAVQALPGGCWSGQERNSVDESSRLRLDGPIGGAPLKQPREPVGGCPPWRKIETYRSSGGGTSPSTSPPPPGRRPRPRRHRQEPPGPHPDAARHQARQQPVPIRPP